MIFKMALYVLKSLGATFRAKLVVVIHKLNNHPSRDVNGIWLRPETKANSLEYYELVLCYVEDLLVINESPSYTI